MKPETLRKGLESIRVLPHSNKQDLSKLFFALCRENKELLARVPILQVLCDDRTKTLENQLAKMKLEIKMQDEQWRKKLKAEQDETLQLHIQLERDALRKAEIATTNEKKALRNQKDVFWIGWLCCSAWAIKTFRTTNAEQTTFLNKWFEETKGRDQDFYVPLSPQTTCLRTSFFPHSMCGTS